MNFIFGFNDGPHITCLSWKCKALTYSLRIPRATYVSIFFFFFTIYSHISLSDRMKKKSHLMQQNENLHMWKHLYHCTSGKCQQQYRRVKLLQISKMFMQNSSFSINCIQTSDKLTTEDWYQYVVQQSRCS